MFSSIVTTVLSAVGAAALTEIFVLIMLLVWCAALALHKFDRWHSFTRYAPTLLTSLGILGTFTGVVVGLLEFDSQIDRIDESISLLLEGLKTAFISSLVGMGLSILYKLLTSLPILALGRADEETKYAVSIDDLYTLQRRQAADQSALLNAVAGQSTQPLSERFIDWNEKREARAEARHSEREAFKREVAVSVLELLKSLDRAGRDPEGLSAPDLLRQLNEKVQRCSVALDDPESSSGAAWQLKQLRMSVADNDERQSSSHVRRENLLSGLVDAIADWRVAHEDREKSLLTVAKEGVSLGMRAEIASEQLAETIGSWKNGAEAHAADVTSRLEVFEELLAQSAGEEIVKALEGVIREFNERLTEQFGKNFQELNTAVGRLLEWQENYREQLAEMRKQYDASVLALKESEIAVASIGEESRKIPECMAHLGEVIEVNQHQLSELERHLGVFEEVRDGAVKALPEVLVIVEKTVRDMTQATDAMAANISGGAQSMQDAIVRSVADYEEATKTVNNEAREIAERSHREIAASFERLQGTLRKTFEESQNAITALIGKEFKNMADSRRELSLDEMTTMSNALLKITGRFTDDYRALVEDMQRVVSQQIDSSR